MVIASTLSFAIDVERAHHIHVEIEITYHMLQIDKTNSKQIMALDFHHQKLEHSPNELNNQNK